MQPTVFRIAGYIANESDWSFSNLQLQKLVYLCQMFHLGHTQKPLFHEYFEAWDYGPVVPVLYHELKMFGAEPVKRYSNLPIAKLSGVAKDIVDQIIVIGSESTPSRLVGLTHQNGGAWSRNYKAGKSKFISTKDILAEYNTLYAKKTANQST